MTTDIRAFIRARLDEDAMIIETIRSGGFPVPTWAIEPSRSQSWHILREMRDPTPIGYVTDGRWQARHVARHGPDRVHRGVEAKRRIVDLHEPVESTAEYNQRAWSDCAECGPNNQADGLLAVPGNGEPPWYPCSTLHAMASEWADHPDYQQEWCDALPQDH